MSKQLTMKAGVAMFAALALAGVLAIFALGAFQPVAAQAMDPSASRSFSPTTVAPGDTVTVTISTANAGGFGIVTEMLPSGFIYLTSNALGVDDSDPSAPVFTFAGTGFTYDVTAPMTPDDYVFSGVLRAGDPPGSYPVGDTTVTVGTGATNGNGETEYKATSETEPGSNQSLMVQGYVDYSDVDNITVDLDKFGVPSSIDTDHVVVSVGVNSANPSDVEIDGKKVTLVAPFETSGASPVKLESDVSDLTSITFRRSAGITLPTLHGDYEIEITTAETDDDGVANMVDVRRQVKVSPTSGKRGTEITITAKGYTDNTHDIDMGSGDNSLSETADATKGVLTLTVDTAVKNNEGNSVFRGPHDTTTTITIGDASATFTIKASFSWKPESPTPGQDITITLADIDPETDADDADVAPSITIGGKAVTGVGNAGDDKPSTWKGQVAGDTPLGNRRIAVSVDDTDLTAQNITVGTNDLTVTPTTVVPRQTISIDGDGFMARGTVDLSDVTVDGVHVRTEAGETQAINNNGNISFDITVPETVSSGPATVKVVGSGDRIGTASITIAEAEITVSPTESLRGETITVSGTGFPASDLVLIKYNEATVGTSNTSPTGTFEKEITVPARENINPGGKYTVEAVSQVNVTDVSDTADHNIKDPDISMDPSSATAGSSITITGSNFKGFLQVHSITIGGQNVTPVPAPSTDKWGSFTASNIQVPQLDATRHAVKVIVGAADGSDGDATEFLTVVTETVVVSTDPAEVFADLISAGSLSRVWYLDPQSQTWSFYDPDPAFAAFNELTEVKSGETYILIITAEDTFGTKTLYPGTQFVTIP